MPASGRTQPTTMLKLVKSVGTQPWQRQCSCCALAFALFSLTVAAHGANPLEAYTGAPFGVARLQLHVPPDTPGQVWRTESIVIRERRQRAWWPVVLPLVPRDDPQTIYVGAQADLPATMTVLFLFVGGDTLQIDVPALDVRSIRVDPLDQPESWRSLLECWWENWLTSRQVGPDGVPTAIDSPGMLLAGLLGRRLDLPRPTVPPGPLTSPTQPWFDLLLGRPGPSGLGPDLSDRLDGPAMAPSDFPPQPRLPDADAHESRRFDPSMLAHQVPADCFFVGAERFSDFMWWLRLSERAIADLEPLLTLWGGDSALSRRLRTQLGLWELPFPDTVADNFIEDVALIGTDLYFEDGASAGILLRAKNPALPLALQGLRQQLARQDPEVDLTSVDVQDVSVSLLRSPDNRLRSYLVVRSPWHLVTNSKSLVRQFLSLPTTGDSLAHDPSFVHPGGDSHQAGGITIYLPSRFQRNLARVDRWIELQRRQQARIEARQLYAAWQLERQTAARFEIAGDGLPAENPPLSRHLIDTGWLPPTFGLRPDDSRALVRNRIVVDSLRGRLGTWLPVSDVSVKAATPHELRGYAKLRQELDAAWPDPPPLMIRGRRGQQTDQPDLWRVDLAVELAPLKPWHHRLLRQFVGTATTETVIDQPEYLVGFEGVPPPRPLLGWVDRRLVVALGQPPAPVPSPAAPLTLRWHGFREFPWLIATRPGCSWLARWDLVGRARGADEGQLVRGPLGVYRQRMEDWYVISPDAGMMQTARKAFAQIRPAPPAQARLRMGDLWESAFSDWLEEILADRRQRMVWATARAMNQLVHDLGLDETEFAAASEMMYGVQEWRLPQGKWQWRNTGAHGGSWSAHPTPPGLTSPHDTLHGTRGLRGGVELTESSFLVEVSVNLESDVASRSAR